jgi:uracil-DNA glycosylase family 4
MDPRTSPKHVEAWLRYFNDLGLGPFYLDRAAVELPVVALPAEKPALPAVHAGARAVESLSRAPSPTHAPPSLFDATLRVEGDSLARIREDIGDCKRCRLCEARSNIVFGDGSPRAQLVFVGEGPGHDEDIQGLPFVGRSGKLLTQMIEAMGLTRADVYICNIVKCRPPQNRPPERDEVATCSPFLDRQLAVLAPKVIVCLGNVAAQTLLGTKKSISAFRGQWFDFRGSKLMATYHPAFLLRTPSAKSEVWTDLKKVMAELGMKPPKPKPRA